MGALKALEEEKKESTTAAAVDLNDTIDLLIAPTAPGLKRQIDEEDQD